MNVITQTRLSRRAVLRGLGATIALPALDAMTPALATAPAKAAPLRLAFVYVPNGIIMPDWTKRRRAQRRAAGPSVFRSCRRTLSTSSPCGMVCISAFRCPTARASRSRKGAEGHSA